MALARRRLLLKERAPTFGGGEGQRKWSADQRGAKPNALAVHGSETPHGQVHPVAGHGTGVVVPHSTSFHGFVAKDGSGRGSSRDRQALGQHSLPQHVAGHLILEPVHAFVEVARETGIRVALALGSRMSNGGRGTYT